jgi:hypothetical protein
MPYSAEHMAEIEHDPVRIKCYYWYVAMNARRRARQRRQAVRTQAVYSSFVAFDQVTDNAREELRRADHEEQFASVILDNIDAMVESSCKGFDFTLALGGGPEKQ